MQNTGHLPTGIRGVGGITVTQTGMHLDIGSGAGEGAFQARGVFDGSPEPAWTGLHPGFEDEITYNDVGDYTFTLTAPLSVEDTEVFVQRMVPDGARPAVGLTIDVSRPSATTVRVMGLLTTDAEAEFSGSIIVVGIPEE